MLHDVSSSQLRHTEQRWQLMKVWITMAALLLIAVHILFPDVPTVQSASDSNLYVADIGVSQVARFNGTTGQRESTVALFYPPPDDPNQYVLRGPSGLALGADGLLYVSSAGTNQILRFNPRTATFVDVFIEESGAYPSPGQGTYHLIGPQDIAFGPDGNLYVVEEFGHVLRFNGRTGAYGGVAASTIELSQIRSTGISGMAFGRDGSLYLSVARENTVLRFNSRTGQFLGIFVAPNSGGLRSPTHLTFGPDGNLYVISYETDQVLRFNGRTGAFLDVFAKSPDNAPYPIPGGPRTGLSGPSGLAFGPDGNLYVSSLWFSQVLRYDGHTGTFMGVLINQAPGILFGPGVLLFDHGPSPAGNAQSKPAFVTVAQHPSPNIAVQPGDTVTYTIAATNRGQGAASNVIVTMPFDPTTFHVLDAHFSRKEAWVSSIDAGALVFQTGRLDSSGDTVTATVRLIAQPELATGTQLGERLTYRWADGHGGGSGQSNLPVLVAAVRADDQPFYSLTTTVEESMRMFGSGVFAPNEPVALWYNTPDGRIVSVPQTHADEKGAIRFTFDSTALSAGTYSMVARGAWSEITAVGTFHK